MVDDEDFEWLSEYSWYASLDNGRWYARTGHKGIRMHKLILNADLVDHKDGNGLHNCRKNLRPSDHSKNIANSIQKYQGTSRYKGVYWDKKHKKWRARIRKNYQLFHIGLFKIEEDAAKAYDQRAIELFGEFANLNFKEKEVTNG